MAQFDLTFQPSIDKRQIKDLQTLRFLHEAHNLIFLGPPGVGKTHLAVALAIEVVEAGHSAYFVTAHDPVSDLGQDDPRRPPGTAHARLPGAKNAHRR